MKNIHLNMKQTEDAIILNYLGGLTDHRKRNTILIKGEPGIAKTTLQKGLLARLQQYDPQFRGIYWDIPTMNIEDLSIPVPDHDTKTTEFYFNKNGGMCSDHPILFFYDEFGKAVNPSVQNMLHPSLTINAMTGRRRIGYQDLHPDCMVVLTSNLGTDGVGDSFKAHTIGRLVTYHMRKPTRLEWVEDFAVDAGVHPIVIAWVLRETIDPFASYLDEDFPNFDSADISTDYRELAELVFNPHPKNPSRGAPYVSPRTLEFASNWLWQVDAAEKAGIEITEQMIFAGLQGAIGNVGARRMMVFRDFAGKLTAPALILADPMAAAVNPSAVIQIMATSQALSWIPNGGFGVDKPATKVEVNDRVTAWFTYMNRMNKEAQMMFIHQLREAATKSSKLKSNTSLERLWSIVVSTTSFQSWATDNSYLY